jgi:hypothetical protein
MICGDRILQGVFGLADVSKETKCCSSEGVGGMANASDGAEALEAEGRSRLKNGTQVEELFSTYRYHMQSSNDRTSNATTDNFLSQTTLRVNGTDGDLIVLQRVVDVRGNM